ncbi:MAG TPA: BamA/TamA family outer membrane protein, partial [Spirochaetia bacterium]|nr:BamA/TamA family outer membrane protein [Spirochaetia bacterium]
LGYTGGLLFGDRDFIRTDSTVEGFLTLFDIPAFENWNLQFVLAAHSELSFILPQYAFLNGSWGWQTITDQTDQVYIDGMNVGRGWGLMYGDALWDNKLELRMPIIKEAIWLVGFFDAAGIWDEPWKMGPGDIATTFTTMNLQQFYFSVGAGIRFSIPQFPIRLYLAWPFQINPANPGGWIVPRTGFSGINLGNVTLGFVISLGGNVF